MSSSTPYDPIVAPNSREEQIQREMDATINVMHNNINNMANRDVQLNALQDKTDRLADSARDFDQRAKVVRKSMWRKNFKMKLCLAAGIIVLIVVIVVPLVVHFT